MSNGSFLIPAVDVFDTSNEPLLYFGPAMGHFDTNYGSLFDT